MRSSKPAMRLDAVLPPVALAENRSVTSHRKRDFWVLVLLSSVLMGMD